jgi:hypothetical protein
VVALSECGTHAFLAAELAAYVVGEKTMAKRLYGRLQPGELLTADRNFYSFQAWGDAVATGAALLWRAPTGLQLLLIRVLADGTYLSVLVNPKLRGARRDAVVATAKAGQDIDPADGYLVRVIEYTERLRTGSGGWVWCAASPATWPRSTRPARSRRLGCCRPGRTGRPHTTTRPRRSRRWCTRPARSPRRCTRPRCRR